MKATLNFTSFWLIAKPAQNADSTDSQVNSLVIAGLDSSSIQRGSSRKPVIVYPPVAG